MAVLTTSSALRHTELRPQAGAPKGLAGVATYQLTQTADQGLHFAGRPHPSAMLCAHSTGDVTLRLWGYNAAAERWFVAERIAVKDGAIAHPVTCTHFFDRLYLELMSSKGSAEAWLTIPRTV